MAYRKKQCRKTRRKKRGEATSRKPLWRMSMAFRWTSCAWARAVTRARPSPARWRCISPISPMACRFRKSDLLSGATAPLLRMPVTASKICAMIPASISG